MDCIVHGVARSWTQLSNSHFHFCFQGYDSHFEENYLRATFELKEARQESRSQVLDDES